MIELPDDELDKLFRKSSEELDPNYDPLDWNELKKRLDEEDGIRGGGWLRKWSPLILLLLLLTGGITTFYVMKNSDGERNLSKVKPSVASNVPGVDSPEDSKALKNKEVTNTTKPDEVNENEASGELDKHKFLTKSKSEKILPRSRSKAGGVYLEPNRSSGKGGEGAFSSNGKKEVDKLNNEAVDVVKSSNPDASIVRPGKTKSELVEAKIGNPAAGKPKKDLEGLRKRGGLAGQKENKNSLVPESPLGNNPSAASENITDKPVAADIKTEADNNLFASVKVNTLINHSFIPGRGPALPEIVIAESPVQIFDPVRPLEPAPWLAVRFSYAPDLSSVGVKDFSKPGASVSLLGEYGILKRLYFQTGVIWSNKRYSAMAGDYILPKGHYYGPAAKSIDGICKVFEIPLNFRYDISQGRTTRWFAGAGMSSYHMNYEKYDYRYENPQDPKINGNWGWKGATGWYLLSHINASVGYEYRVSRRLSLMAEPYVRVPVKRVGYGSVNLFTTGMWLSLRYTPVFR